jgi:nicotinate-nucleotide pyrophosphorylase (carboxylating)
MMDGQVGFRGLLPNNWKTYVQSWLQEDIPSFDYGGFVVGEKQETATLYCKADGVLAGCPFFEEVFAQCDCSVEWLSSEGAMLQLAGSHRLAVAKVKGTARQILIGERSMDSLCYGWVAVDQKRQA